MSLRSHLYRILDDEEGNGNWADLLQTFWVEDIMSDPDVRRHALRGEDDPFASPGLVIPFTSTIASGRNFFGRPLLAGDPAFSPASFATKIYAVGIALPGYVGLADPGTNISDIDFTNSTAPVDPDSTWLDPDALSATPYIYLIPAGADSMRSPPLGDTGAVRTWDVRDVVVPLPFNIGASEFATTDSWQSADFLTEEMFMVRKHQPFRPVSGASVFSINNFGTSGYMQTSPFTNSRLIGRSVWNSQWKVVIPGSTLLEDPEEGLRRLIRTVEDIQIHFITYSYSGN